MESTENLHEHALALNVSLLALHTFFQEACALADAAGR